MSKNKVGEGREGKGREGTEEFWLATSHISVGKLGGAIIIKLCTRVHIGYVMILANFSVVISRGVNSVRG